ncbi:unnamed protein product, partial [Vitis vinifera]|uniref:Uncharacterized protein n=1 Tax=Vitis vinifera TaxID=29760 RepID=D7SRJ7_VITVI
MALFFLGPLTQISLRHSTLIEFAYGQDYNKNLSFTFFWCRPSILEFVIHFFKFLL